MWNFIKQLFYNPITPVIRLTEQLKLVNLMSRIEKRQIISVNSANQINHLQICHDFTFWIYFSDTKNLFSTPDGSLALERQLVPWLFNWYKLDWWVFYLCPNNDGYRLIFASNKQIFVNNFKISQIDLFKIGIQMRNLSQFYIFSIFCNASYAGFVSGNSFDVVKRVDEVVNIAISDHLREVLNLS